MMIDAKSLRKDIKLISTCAGCYKWWAKKDELDFIMRIIDPNNTVCCNGLEKIECGDNELYCIYVGKTKNYKYRFKNHFGKIGKSTLRRSISAIIKENGGGCTVDVFIDKLYVEFIGCNASDLDITELKLIHQYVRPLNIQDNCNCPDVTINLRKIR